MKDLSSEFEEGEFPCCPCCDCEIMVEHEWTVVRAHGSLALVHAFCVGLDDHLRESEGR